MKYLSLKGKFLFMLAFIFISPLLVHSQKFSLEEADSFYPNSDTYNSDNISWSYLNVPENWDDSQSQQIKIAVTTIHNSSNNSNAPAVVFIQGGPGASGIETIRHWRNHPLREKNDIILLDLRGTGFSQPRLCEDLGTRFVEILAKNQSRELDEQQKANASLECKQDLLNRGIDINAYNSFSIAYDLHALKETLGYDKWVVYGVSYGTYVAQVYASWFPEEIKKIVLDSSVLDIHTFYTQNTSNYMSALQKVFDGCKGDADCNEQYPNLEQVYYNTIAALSTNPITVNVDTDLSPEGTFTYNAEDFKIALQQALYNKQLVEVIPLLIYQFSERKYSALENLATSFTSLLKMDYGVYYSVSCTEALPNNELDAYNKNAAQFEGLKGGLSFYQSDFLVCDNWQLNPLDSLVKPIVLKKADYPVLVFSGEYDPITPEFNGKKVADLFSNSKAITGLTYGHVPSFTQIGSQVAASFINTGSYDSLAFSEAIPLAYVKNITLNAGVPKLANSIGRFDVLFFAPLLIALLIMLFFVFSYIVKLARRRYATLPDKVMRILTIFTSFAGLSGLVGLIIALMEVANRNQFILAFGLPSSFDYLQNILLAFLLLAGSTIIYFLINVKKISDRSVVFSLIFSQILLGVYLFYWGIV
jgi:pimeloyl-ACP methyl ester carboxylesterase